MWPILILFLQSVSVSACKMGIALGRGFDSCRRLYAFKRLWMEKQIQHCLSALQSRHIKGIFAENFEEGRQKILGLIPMNAVVGIGDSTAVKQMGILQILKDRGTKVLNPFKTQGNYLGTKEAEEARRRVQKEASICDVFLTGTNAITQDGRLVNMDATGNRVAGMFWGHPISIVVVGKNKIVRDLDEAFHRIRNIIAPNHVRIRSVELGGRKRKAPCAATGECSDCRAIDKICNILTIIEGKPSRTNLNVVIVNEDMGLGFDTSWSQARITKIIKNYKKFVWISPRKNR